MNFFSSYLHSCSIPFNFYFNFGCITCYNFFLLSFSCNILINKHKEAKIGDLGLAGFLTDHSSELLDRVSKQMNPKLFGTLAYLPPEFGASKGKRFLETDVYSFGVVSCLKSYFTFIACCSNHFRLLSIYDRKFHDKFSHIMKFNLTLFCRCYLKLSQED